VSRLPPTSASPSFPNVLYQTSMGTPPKASASIVAAAIIAILAALLLLVGCSFAFLGTLLFPSPHVTPPLPPPVRAVMMVMWGVMMAVSVFGIITGIGLLRLRNWARISVLIWGGLCVFFGGIGIPIAFLLPTFAPPNAPALPPGSQHMVQVVLLFIYGLPLTVGVWCLILFNRKSVQAQFAEASALAGAALTQEPRCPLPVTVVAWFYLTSILNFVFLPFFPLRIPVFIFGLALPRRAGIAILLLSALGLFAAGVGLLKLKPWSYSLAIGLQMFWLASTAVSMFNPNYNAAMLSYLNDFQAWMHLPDSQLSPENFMRQFAWMMKLGLVVAGAILGILVYYRPRFLAAASAATAPPEQRVTS